MGFVFATCHPEVTAALKDDVARQSPDLRLAFSRPGLLTFKSDATSAVVRPSVWARTWGTSLGRATSAAEVDTLIPAAVRRLHVYARDSSIEGADALVAEVQAALLSLGRFDSDPQARLGEVIADVIVSPGEPWLCGTHVFGRGRSPWPGGGWPVQVPSDSPSRAYAKIEEAIAWAELPIVAGHVAVEVGSAPGGAAYALARRGVTVWGVDPAAMDPGVLAFVGPRGARVHHLAESLAAVRWESLPRAVDWLLCDVHLAPPVALHGLARLVPAWKRSLRGAVITLKMNDLAMRRGLPTWIERVRGLGFSAVEVTHLPANRNEVCVVARRSS
jgi:23S rRNA (cytidine2498-2'-O)-methyltransferase